MVYGKKFADTGLSIWAVQALDSVKKAGSSIPKDDAKRFEKEVGQNC